MKSVERNKLPDNLECPHCGRTIKTKLVVRKGFIRGRPQSRGGPYYKFKCIYCHNELDCFFGKEVFTRKADRKKALIDRLTAWLRFIPLIGASAENYGHRHISENLHRDKNRCENGRIPGSFTSNGCGDAGSHADMNDRLPMIFRIHPELLASFRVLGLDPDAPVKEIKKRYKKLVRDYHPDRTGDLDEIDKQIATKKLVEITKAYGTIKDYFM